MKAHSLLVLGALAAAGVSSVVACSSSSSTGDTGTASSGADGGKKGSGSGSGAGGGDSGDSTGDDAGGSGSGSSGGGSGSGSGDDSGSAGSGSSDGGPSTTGTSSTPSSAFLPTTSKQTCPTLKTGEVTVSGTQVQIWAGTPTADQHGAVVFYWHGTGSNSAEATYGLGQAQINAITAAGGLVASFSTTTMTGTNTGNMVWYTGDFDMADDLLACAITQLHVDPRKVFTAGISAGGLQATWMAYARSGYIAAAAPISGGLAEYNGFYSAPVKSPQDPSNVPAAMAIHGALGKDVVSGFDFAVASAVYEADVAKKGGYSMDCNTGGAHAGGPPAVSPGIWQFFQDHPFKVQPQPYGAIPAIYPKYCQTGPIAADGGAP